MNCSVERWIVEDGLAVIQEYIFLVNQLGSFKILMAKNQCLTFLSHYLTSLHETIHTCVTCFFKARPAKKKMWYQTSAINFLVLSGYWESKWLLPTVETALLPFNRMYFIPQYVESISIQPSRCISSHNINVIFIILSKCISFHLIRLNLSISSYTVIGIFVPQP